MRTTRTEKQPLPPLGIGALGVLLLALSAPVCVARFMDLPGDPVRKEMQAGRRHVTEAALDTLRAARMRVIRWSPSAERYNDLALVSMERGTRLSGERAKAAFSEAEIWQSAALARAPSDPFGWFRLAYLYVMIDGKKTARSAAAWEMSMLAAPYEPTIMLARLQMGIDHLPLLSPAGREALPRLVRGSAVFDAEGLARIAKAGAFTSFVEAVLADDPEALDAFRKRVDGSAYESNRDRR